MSLIVMVQPLIDNPAALAALCQHLQSASWVAIDSEFVRERTYYARLCLLQVATESQLACIDVLALEDLSPLADVLLHSNSIKVMHAPQQDLEILRHLWGQVPEPLFDTQVAAALLGQGEQIGYAALVKSLLGVSLDKSQTRTDWSRRPLSEAQLRYAIDDVRFLGELYAHQRVALTNLDRLDWLWAETGCLTTPPVIPTSSSSWQRVKGHRSLRGLQLAVLQVLADWRERQAEQRDLPRQWVIRDEDLLTLVRRMPRNTGQLQRLKLDNRVIRRDGEALLQQILQALQVSPEDWPVLTTHDPLDEHQQALLEQAQVLVRECAGQYGIAPTLLATRRDLEHWLVGTATPVLEGWRATLLGEPLAQLCDLQPVHLVTDGSEFPG